MSYSNLILNLQKLLLGIFGVSTILLVGLLFLSDPFSNQLYFISFLAGLFVFLSSFFCLLGFWVSFSKKFVDLNDLSIVGIIKQSILASTFLCCLVFLQSINLINFLSFGLLTFSYILFEIWAI